MQRLKYNILLSLLVLVIAVGLMWFSLSLPKGEITTSGTAHGVFLNKLAFATPTAVVFLVVAALTLLIGFSIFLDFGKKKRMSLQDLTRGIKE